MTTINLVSKTVCFFLQKTTCSVYNHVSNSSAGPRTRFVVQTRVTTPKSDAAFGTPDAPQPLAAAENPQAARTQPGGPALEAFACLLDVSHKKDLRKMVCLLVPVDLGKPI